MKEKPQVFNRTEEIRWVPCRDRAGMEQCERKYIEETTNEVVWFGEYVWGTTQRVLRIEQETELEKIERRKRSLEQYEQGEYLTSEEYFAGLRQRINDGKLGK